MKLQNFSWNFSCVLILAMKHSHKHHTHSHILHFLFIWYLASIFYRIKHRVVVVLRFEIWEYERKCKCLFSIDKQHNTQTMHVNHQLLKICLFSFYFMVYSLRCEMCERDHLQWICVARFNFSRILLFSAVFIRTFFSIVVLALISVSTMLLIHR